MSDFLPNGLLLEAHYDLKKDLVAQSNGNISGYFLLRQICSIFLLNRHFQNMVLRVLKVM
jgi:hypothetical protein